MARPLYATAQEYRAAFDALKRRGVAASYWRFLQAHLALASRPITWRQLGTAMGYRETTAHTLVNL
jgi:hypothetical protein